MVCKLSNTYFCIDEPWTYYKIDSFLTMNNLYWFI